MRELVIECWINEFVYQWIMNNNINWKAQLMYRSIEFSNKPDIEWILELMYGSWWLMLNEYWMNFMINVWIKSPSFLFI